MIVATNPSLEGRPRRCTCSASWRRSADDDAHRTGLPVGGDLEYADGVTIAQALSARREMHEAWNTQAGLVAGFAGRGGRVLSVEPYSVREARSFQPVGR